ADAAIELAESDQRTRERYRADQDADIDLDFVDDFLGALELQRGIDVAGKPHQAGGEAHQAVHQGHQFRHLGHFDYPGGVQAYGAAYDQRCHDPGNARCIDTRPEHRGQHGQGHAENTEPGSAPRRPGARPPSQAPAAQGGGAQASQRINSSGRPACPASGDAICTSAPMAMMLEMALVTLISGVCSAGVTFHTTMYPMKQASTNTVKWPRKAAGA